ncbi:MAG: twin-arginine translocation signal domain-containing protein, partial [Shewanella sp.]
MDTHAALYEQGKARLDALRQFAPRQQHSLIEKMQQHGISRRDFMKWSAMVTSMLALPLPFSNLV